MGARPVEPRLGERATKAVSVVLPLSEADWIARIAKVEQRPVSDVIRLLLRVGLGAYQRSGTDATGRSLAELFPDRNPGAPRAPCSATGRVLLFPAPPSDRDEVPPVA